MTKFSQGNKKASKLVGAQVMLIREKYATGMYTYARLAREYLVTVNTISSIVNGLTWQELPSVTPEHVVEEGALRSQRKLEALLAMDNLPPAVVVDDETLAAMEKAVADIPQPEFNKPSADMAARMAAYGVRAKDRDPPTADTGRGGYYKVENGVQPPVEGQYAAGLSGGTTGMREESYENVDQSSGEECDKDNGGEELVAGSAIALHEDPHS